MNQDLETAVYVLVIGMVTVFFVLGLVVGIGQVLIRIVNYGTQTETDEALPRHPASSPPDSAIPAAHLAVIISAVETMTRGRGHITHIDKLNEAE